MVVMAGRALALAVSTLPTSRSTRTGVMVNGALVAMMPTTDREDRCNGGDSGEHNGTDALREERHHDASRLCVGGVGTANPGTTFRRVCMACLVTV